MPIAGKTLFQGMSVRVFPEKISIWSSILSREIQPPHCGRALPNSLLEAPKWSQKGKCFLIWFVHHFLPSALELLVLRSLESKLMPAIPWCSGLQTQAQFYHRLFLALKLADSRLQEFSTSITSWANPIINLLICICYGSISLEKLD